MKVTYTVSDPSLMMRPSTSVPMYRASFRVVDDEALVHDDDAVARCTSEDVVDPGELVVELALQGCQALFPLEVAEDLVGQEQPRACSGNGKPQAQTSGSSSAVGP